MTTYRITLRELVQDKALWKTKREWNLQAESEQEAMQKAVDGMKGKNT
jgi:hypothetical protein